MSAPGSLLTLDIEKPAAGGWMIARHEGRIVLVSGAIPGERVTARITRIAKGVTHAETVDVISASADRRVVTHDWRCGGSVFAHIAYARQVQIKGEILQDAFRRIARFPLSAPPDVLGSPEEGYRMRARLHVAGTRVGFFRDGTHQVCDAGPSRQLSQRTTEWLASVEADLERHHLTGIASIEIAENIPGDARACHVELHAGHAAACAVLAHGLTGLSVGHVDRHDATTVSGTPIITDRIAVRDGLDAPTLHVQRSVRSFFQGNRFLFEPLVQRVVARVGSGPVVDLYAGVGVFGLAAAAGGAAAVTLVEGDAGCAKDLQFNARPFEDRVRVEGVSVERALTSGVLRPSHAEVLTCIVDPPRTGISRDAMLGLGALRPARVVYISCDVATLARDARLLMDDGYELQELTGMDLFPNTAHVEAVALLTR